MGGKNRIATQLVDAVCAEVGEVSCWVEPFVGGGSVAAVAAERFGCQLVLSDVDPLTTLLWDRSSSFSLGELQMTRAEYDRLRAADGDDMLTALTAFGASWGGKKWGGFAAGGGRDYFAEGVRSWRRKFDAMSSASLVTSECLPYWRVVPPAGSVVYCDPPYAGTTGYRSGEFDHARFFAWCEAQTVPVFVSEFSAPEHWRVVFERDVSRSMRSADGSSMPEKLFRVA
jgi:DNA adenine methylase